MKCKECNTEMFIDSTKIVGNSETFNYKCPNANCTNYGYGGVENESENNKDE